MIVRKILLLLLVPAFLLGCIKDQSFAYDSNTHHRTDFDNRPSGYNVYGSWVVSYYEDLENGTVINKSDVDSWGGLDVEIKFMDDHTFCGINTTNAVAGHYLQSDSTINIDVYGGTKIGQPEWGNMFSDLVHSHSIKSFERSNSQLRLFYNNHKNCIILNPKRREIVCKWTYSNN